MLTNIIEIIGVVSSVMGIIGIPSIKEYLKSRKNLGTLETKGKAAIQKNYQPYSAESAAKYINTSETLDLPYPKNNNEPEGGASFILLILALGLGFVYMMWSISRKSFGERLTEFKDMFNGKEMEADHTFLYFLIYAAVCIVFYFIFNFMKFNTETNRQKYFSFLYDKIDKDGTTHLKNKVGYLNKGYEEILPCIFDDIEHIYGGLLQVRLNGKLGLIARSGKIILPVKYDKIDDINFDSKFVDVRVNNNKFRISKYGRRDL